MTTTLCLIEACQTAAYCKGKCRLHYHKEKTRAWREANREHSRALARKHDKKRRQSQARRDYERHRLDEYVKSESGRRARLETLKRYAVKRKRAEELATPAWADLTEIARIYRERPPGMEVDHIVPLLGKDVCGLHVPYNLQYLTKAENRRKGNRCG